MKNKGFVIIGVALALVTGLFIGSQWNFHRKWHLFPESKAEMKLRNLLDYIRYEYVDEVDTDSLIEIAIHDIMTRLDPHSGYIPPSELQQLHDEMEGKFIGIGIRFHLYKDTVTVDRIIPGGPAAKAGVQRGDRILLINSDTVFGKALSGTDIVEEINNTPSDDLTLRLYRPSDRQYVTISLTKGKVPLSSVPVSFLLNPATGYIKIDKFARNTADEFHTALKKLTQSGMKNLILDLRDNSGGYMKSADDIADEFLTDGTLIVSTVSKDRITDRFYATSKGLFEEGNLYVLVNENTASASEILAGALQDQDRATIIGRRTYGKGLVQQEMKLGDGSAIRLTTARYYTPTGRSIQKPYTNGHNKEYFNDELYRYKNGELFHKDSIRINDSLKYTTPKGKTVYGGGGIIPDYFVAKNHGNYIPFYYEKMNEYVFQYFDSHRRLIETMDTADFKAYYQRQNLCGKYLEYRTVLPYHPPDKKKICRYLYQYFIHEIYGTTALYKIRIPDDDMVRKALSLIDNQTNEY